MSNYDNFIGALDALCLEAPITYKRYHPEPSDLAAVNYARSRSLIHLFLKVKFGLLSFDDRERHITDDPDDGGIDAYYIDQTNKTFYFIQSKFRTNSKNFEQKEIALEELLLMDVERISKGESSNAQGTPYNPKISRLISEIRDISDKPKYEYRIIILANLRDSIQSNLDRIAAGYIPEVLNHERCYCELLFPLASGTFYQAEELTIPINVSSNSAGHRIDYAVTTSQTECNVNALFVPTLEIAKLMTKYRNAILLYNPRSYLDLHKGSVNAEIAQSMRKLQTNEFALFNNGITMISDGTRYSDRVGKKGIAEILVTNPQIINGGQTAFTLSRIYDECLETNSGIEVFEGKEVLLKIITLTEAGLDIDVKRQLIEDISRATNNQTPVTEADRRANDKVQIEIQDRIFKTFGLFYERKRGEFADGTKLGYVPPNELLDREVFLRCALAAQLQPHVAQAGQDRLFALPFFSKTLPDSSNYRKYVYTYLAYKAAPKLRAQVINLAHARYAICAVVAQSFSEGLAYSDYQETVEAELARVAAQWSDFEETATTAPHNKTYFYWVFHKRTGERIMERQWAMYYKAANASKDIEMFFGLG